MFSAEAASDKNVSHEIRAPWELILVLSRSFYDGLSMNVSRHYVSHSESVSLIYVYRIIIYFFLSI